jgi:hypothetical protein
MKIQVTAEHIRDGQRCNSARCPIALALQEPAWEARAGAILAVLSDGFYRLPYEVRKFMRDFDRGLPVEPFEFELGEPGL